jgi:hypothetical protein
MIDENAFGMLVANHHFEDEEYGTDDMDEVVDRITLFRRLVLQYLAEHPPASGAHALDLGHALYVELPEEGASGLLAWAKALRTELAEHDFESTFILSHGGRWVDTAGAELRTETAGAIPVTRLAGPSEPLRRALFAETATHGAPDEESAWGAGLYLDTDAAEALNIRPKNEPTRLEVAGAAFFRVSR